MNDVLAKPFTRDGMIRILRKHLPHLLKNPPPPGLSIDDVMPLAEPSTRQAPVGGYSGHGGMSLGQMAGPPSIQTAAPVKYETTPIQSPATTSSWHSPSQMTQTSPHTDGGAFLTGAVNSGQPMVLTPGGTHRPTFHGGPAPPMAGDDRPEKRQRVYGPGQPYPQQ